MHTAQWGGGGPGAQYLFLEDPEDCTDVLHGRHIHHCSR